MLALGMTWSNWPIYVDPVCSSPIECLEFEADSIVFEFKHKACKNMMLHVRNQIVKV